MARDNNSTSNNTVDVMPHFRDSSDFIYFYVNGSSLVNEATPWAWSVSDGLTVFFSYPVDPDWTP